MTDTATSYVQNAVDRPRYTLEPAPNGGLVVNVPKNRGNCLHYTVLVLFCVGVVVTISAILPHVGFWERLLVIWAVTIPFGILLAYLFNIDGEESYVISTSTFTHMWNNAGLVRGTTDYKLAKMGPLHVVASPTWMSILRHGGRRHHVQFGFHYGTALIKVDNLLVNQGEVDAFLRDIAPYLPDHVKPIMANDVVVTVQACN
ncbi:Aste57867_12715 [Aphanomyces stellatus]|uniref:Aste57867_12715 protein n=1 Tax=Aphanomyces stellatus TaxID=120398 RepID=A0A485KX41_9STRA|nr:hypothetical protein As57867_012667 [Aphanomyces stellatus]VFT89565.1 Aste57867_12715 [Aphanomyces stellatus]